MISTPRFGQTTTHAPSRRTASRAAAGAALVLALMQFIPGPPPHVGTADAAPPSQTVLRIDPNVASRAELMLLPRIGPALADYIIEHRESRAPELAFMQPEDLDRVHRVGPLTVERLRPYLRFDSAEPPLVRKVAE